MIFTGPNKENLAKYGKNFPYKAWLPSIPARTRMCSCTALQYITLQPTGQYHHSGTILEINIYIWQ